MPLGGYALFRYIHGTCQVPVSHLPLLFLHLYLRLERDDKLRQTTEANLKRQLKKGVGEVGRPAESWVAELKASMTMPIITPCHFHDTQIGS